MRKDSTGKIWQVSYFKDCQVNQYFWNNGSLWRKRSTRTAVTVRPERYAGSWFYFGQSETIETQYTPAIA